MGMTDRLTKDEKLIYNKVRDELLLKDAELQAMDELDRILYERIKLSNVVDFARNLTKMTNDIKLLNDPVFCKGNNISEKSFNESFNDEKWWFMNDSWTRK